MQHPHKIHKILQSKTIEQPFFSFLSRKVYRFVAIVVIRGGGEGEKIGFIAKPTTNQPNPTSEDASENLKLLLFYSSHVAVCLYTMSQLVGCTAHWTVQNDWPKIQWKRKIKKFPNFEGALAMMRKCVFQAIHTFLIDQRRWKLDGFHIIPAEPGGFTAGGAWGRWRREGVDGDFREC